MFIYLLQIAVFFCLLALSHARRGIFTSSLGANIGQVAGFGYNGNLGFGYGTNPIKRRHRYGWQSYAPGNSGGYVGLGGYGSNSFYTGQGIPPVVNTVAPNSPYNTGFPGNGVYGSGGPLGSPGYGGSGYGGYGYGNIW